MSINCGVDIVEIERVKDSIENTGEAFLKRVFSDREIEYCENRKAARFQSYAARFAAKEAVSKAFGTGISGGIKWKDIEVLNDEAGKPNVVMSGRIKELFAEIKGKNISLSLSHCKNYAVAYAVIELED